MGKDLCVKVQVYTDESFVKESNYTLEDKDYKVTKEYILNK